MPRLQRADDIAGRHRVTGRHERLDRFDGGENLPLPHRDDGPVDDDASEVHGAARDGDHGNEVRHSTQVDAAVPDPVGSRRGHERPHDRAGPVDGPDPARHARRRRVSRTASAAERAGRTEREHGDEGEHGETHDDSIVASAAS
nr:hypothetical protein [Microcella sp.]